jgi:DNA-binding NarL/FixJ family response regulator
MAISALERGREAVRLGRWTTAFTEFSAADRECELEPFDLALLAQAAHLGGKEKECLSALSRCHLGFLAAEDFAAAARSAFWLGFTLMNGGEMAQAAGWFARARRILDDSGTDSVERGYLQVPVAIRSMQEGDTAAALVALQDAMKIGERFGDKDLVALARQGQGRALIRQGEIAKGLSLIDEAMVAVTAGEISAGVVGGIYCSVIEGCSEVFDLRRVQEWTSALDRWCSSQPETVPYRSHCLVRRAEMLQLHGSWSEALQEAAKARDLLLDPTPKRAVRAAYYRLAELHRLRGDYDEAESLYREASKWGDELARPGLALLRLVKGEIAAAGSLIKQAAAERQDPCSRAHMLVAFVEIEIAAGDLRSANAAASELGEIAHALKATILHALAARAQGAVLLASQDPESAMPHLRTALTQFSTLNAPYEAARTRSLIAEALRAQGQASLAEMETLAACEAYRMLGATPDVKCAERLLNRKSEGVPLTDRELEVLKLVASGATNRKIATKLAISEKTVARHISNIFNKLDLNSRAAATAYAFQHRLV